MVAAGAADRCEVQVAYAIGVAHPVSIMVETFGTEHVAVDRIEAAVGTRSSISGPVPSSTISSCGGPSTVTTAAYGHFGRQPGESFTWERTDRADALKSQLGL